ncbi:hypothetical protein KSC_008760 [Ktedonobacter sp. SOSP1-52]|nr:hypothetical protein KSC_008760 [Ktedonobacter sp. SOSP1-52]
METVQCPHIAYMSTLMLFKNNLTMSAGCAAKAARLERTFLAGNEINQEVHGETSWAVARL